jgi:hypothetical protein
MSQNISNIMIVIIAIFGIIIIVMAGFIVYLHRKLNRFLSDSHAVGLDSSIVDIKRSIRELELFRNELEKYLVNVENRLKRSVQSVHTVRFNPFKGTGSGGNQSFATAFLNEENDGVVISSLYSRDHVSIFSKPIKAGASEYELSGEEITATKEAGKLLKTGGGRDNGRVSGGASGRVEVVEKEK